jgi:hypothetical protein
MTDLVGELRDSCEFGCAVAGLDFRKGYGCVRCRAAAEIERLRVKLKMVQRLKAKHHTQDRLMTAKRDAALEALRAYRNGPAHHSCMRRGSKDFRCNLCKGADAALLAQERYHE